MLGAWTMLRHYSAEPGKVKMYVYAIDKAPDVDISHVDYYGDFKYLKEVRYRNSVQGKYIGLFVIDDYFHKQCSLLYEFINSEPWDEFSDKTRDTINEFVDFILGIKEGTLNNLKVKENMLCQQQASI